MIAVDRLGSGVSASASFQIFALTAGGVLGWEGNCPGGEMSGAGNMSGGTVLHTSRRTTRFERLSFYCVVSRHYRAMLCISAVFAVMRCLCVCVCPSVTFLSCVKTNKDIFEIFSPSGSHTILVFPCETGWRYSDGNPLTGASKARGYEKNDDFRPISRSISETVIVGWAHAARQFVSIEFSFHPYNI